MSSSIFVFYLIETSCDDIVAILQNSTLNKTKNEECHIVGTFPYNNKYALLK